MNLNAAFPLSRKRGPQLHFVLGGLLLLAWCSAAQPPEVPTPGNALSWPVIGSQQRPWTYWWWHGSAVDTNSITHELQRFRDAGLGGAHIIPIFGTKGYEEKA